MKKKVAPTITKTDHFIEIYLKTGNATEAAWKTFKCSTRASAQAMGSYCLKKNRAIVRALMDQREITISKLIDVAWEKCQKSNKPDFFDRLIKIGGYDQ